GRAVLGGGGAVGGVVDGLLFGVGGHHHVAVLKGDGGGVGHVQLPGDLHEQGGDVAGGPVAGQDDLVPQGGGLPAAGHALSLGLAGDQDLGAVRQVDEGGGLGGGLGPDVDPAAGDLGV